MKSSKDAKTALHTLLAQKAREHYGPNSAVDNLTKLSGGASRETWSFDIVDGDTVYPLILKRDPITYGQDGTASVDAQDDTWMAVDRKTEGRLIDAAHKSGMPVPQIGFFLEPSPETSAGFVMERLDGEVLGRRVLRNKELAEARGKLAFQCGQAIGQFHNLSPAQFPTLDKTSIDNQLTYYEGQLDQAGHPYPGFEYGMRWLKERAELAGTDVSIVHGDFRLGNLVIGPDGLRGVLDFELAHLGNPVSDLGWLCVKSWRYGETEKQVGGFGTLAQLLEGYKASTGKTVAPEAVAYWEVFGTLRWGMMCVDLAFNHLSGNHPSLEKAVIGRRSAETEYDLLSLIN